MPFSQNQHSKEYSGKEKKKKKKRNPCFPHFPLQLQMRRQMRPDLCPSLPKRGSDHISWCGLQLGHLPRGLPLGRQRTLHLEGYFLECVHPAPKGDAWRSSGAGNSPCITALISKYSSQQRALFRNNFNLVGFK